MIDDRGFALNVPDILFPAPDEILPPNATFLDARFSSLPTLQYEVEYEGGYVPADFFGRSVFFDFFYDPRLNGRAGDLNIPAELRFDAASFPAPSGIVPIEQAYLVDSSVFGIGEGTFSDPASPLPLSARVQVFIESSTMPITINAVRGTFSISPEVTYFYLPAVPTPAALPAGLMLLVVGAGRRR